MKFGILSYGSAELTCWFLGIGYFSAQEVEIPSPRSSSSLVDIDEELLINLTLKILKNGSLKFSFLFQFLFHDSKTIVY